MTGLPEFNYPAFHAVAKDLRDKGYQVFNPAENHGGDTSLPLEEYFAADLPQVVRADALVVLPGWERSGGACIEVMIARHLGHPVLDTNLEELVDTPTATDPKPLETTFEDVFDGIAFEGLKILYDRQRKYGPENIRQQGLWGILTRIKDDKIERVRAALNGSIKRGVIVLDEIADENDETFEDALFDISNYALIMIAVKRGIWGFPLREDTGEIETLAAAHPDGVPQMALTQEEARAFLAGEDDGTESPEFYEGVDELAPLASEKELDDLHKYLKTPDEVLEALGVEEPIQRNGPLPDREAAIARLEAARQARNLGGKD
jgi:hypothetical protein